MKIAIITARGGSKRIPRKNIKNFCGKPIIAYSILTAINAHCFDEVMVSTDDAEIAKVSTKYGAKVPFMRSAAASNDYAVTADVILEVIKEYQKRDIHPEFVCCIYPTAPFVTTENLLKGLQVLKTNTDIHAVNPVVAYSYPIQRALRIQNGFISMINPEHLLTRSQDLERTYHDVGQFYWFKVKEFLNKPMLLGPNTAGIQIPEWQVQDIDNEDDWIMAEMKYHMLEQQLINQEEHA